MLSYILDVKYTIPPDIFVETNNLLRKANSEFDTKKE